MHVVALRLVACLTPMLVAAVVGLMPPATSSPAPATPVSACRC